MAAGDRNKNNKAIDIVRHYRKLGDKLPLCKQKRFGYTTDDKDDITCTFCLKLLKKLGESRMIKLAPIYRRYLLLKEDGEAAGSLELRNTPIETIVQYANKLGLKISNLQSNLEVAYDLFGMGKTKRKDMPVIDDKDVRDFQKHLSNGFIDLTDPWSDRTNQDDPFPQGLTDKDAARFMSNGIRDTSKPDDVIKTQIRMVVAKDLIPIQQQVYASKSLGRIAKGGIEATKQFLSTTTLVISSDQRIIDGHHRFLSALIINPDMKLKCLEVDLPIKTLLPLARAYGDAKGNQRNL